MTDKELKKLNRLELLELLVAQGKDLEECQNQLAKKDEEMEDVKAQVKEATKQVENLQAKLKTRTIDETQPGNLADAAIEISGLFEAAQKTADEYISKLRHLHDEQEAKANEKLAQIEVEANKLLDDTRLRCNELERITKEKCQDKIREAEEESQKYWKAVSMKLDAFYQAHQGLKELLNTLNSPIPEPPVATVEETTDEGMYEKYLAEYEDLAG